MTEKFYKKKFFSILISVAISGSVLFFLLFHKDTLGNTLILLHETELEFIFFALLLGPIVQYLRAWRFQRLLFTQMNRPDFRMIQIATNLNFFNYILPFRIGEASFPLMLKRSYGMEYKVSAAALVFVRLSDLAIVLGIIGVALIAFGRHDVGALFVVNALAFLIFLLILPRYSSRWIFALKKVNSNKVNRWIDAISSGFTLVSRAGDQFWFLPISFAIWLCQFTICYFCLRAVMAEASYVYGIVSGGAAIFSFSLPINGIAGLGPVQAAWAYALQMVGVAFDVGISSSIVFSGVTIASISIQSAVIFAISVFRRSDLYSRT